MARFARFMRQANDFVCKAEEAGYGARDDKLPSAIRRQTVLLQKQDTFPKLFFSIGLDATFSSEQ